jgi:hypothetical protein
VTADAKRDRTQISDGELAWWTLQGDEDLQFAREYLAAAPDVLGQYLVREHGKIGADDDKRLSDLMMMLDAVAAALDPVGDSEFKIEIKRRRAGKPVNLVDRSNAGFRAAGIVERLVATGTKQEAAIAAASSETGLSRSVLFEYLGRRRHLLAMQSGQLSE